MRRQICIVLAAVVFVFCAAQATARVHWLPDFLQDNTDRVNVRADKEDKPIEPTRPDNSCPSGWIHASSKTDDMICNSVISLPNAGFCYADCRGICDAYTDMDENGNCTYGCAKYYGICPSKCEQCHTDNCHNRTDNITEWGCKQSYTDCESKCEIPYEDNCHNRTDNKTDWGCDKKWDDCDSKCEVGSMCNPNSCSSDYNLDNIPTNAMYDTCTTECGDKKYKFLGCASGFYDKAGFVCKLDGDTEPKLCTWSLNQKLLWKTDIGECFKHE